MTGTGEHLHSLIKRFTGEDYKPGCGCEALVKLMNANPPQWTLDNMTTILEKIRLEAKARGWWQKIAVAIPGASMPMRWMIRESARLAEVDLKAAGECVA
jgi:hypothetical protein